MFLACAVMMLWSSGGGPSAIRIVIVDDFQEWRLKVRSILKNRPEWEIISEASNGFEAVHAQELRPDVILMAIGLPNLNGIEAAERILRDTPDTKIIFLTQNNDKAVFRAALSTGALGYVLKAQAGREVVPAVEAVLQGVRFVSAGMQQDDFKDPEGALTNRLPSRTAFTASKSSLAASDFTT